MTCISAFPPRLVQRHCGGWLALSSRDDTLRIGVAGESEDAARSQYETTRAEWRALLSGAVVGEGEAAPHVAGLSTAT